MNTDKIYAEHLANEYAPKDDSKVITLRKLDAKASNGIPLLRRHSQRPDRRCWHVFVHERDRKRQPGFLRAGRHHRAHRPGGHGRQLSRLQENPGEGKAEVRF